VANLNDKLWSINAYIANINRNTSKAEGIGSILACIERNTKATMDSAKIAHRNILFISIIAVFWSVFVCWKNYDEILAFFHAVTNLPHLFP
jgi:hypothetical protein